LSKTWICCLLILLFSGQSLAQTRYVTDLLRLNLHEQPQSQGKIIKTVISGDPLVVLENQPGYAKVRSADGLIGWTKSAYLVDDKPPRLIVTQLEKKVVKLNKQKNKAVEEKIQAQKDAAKYKTLLETNKQNEASVNSQIETLREQNKTYESAMRTYGSSIPLDVFLVSILVILVLGFALGWYIIDYRIRKRHGGFRLY